MQSCGCPWGPCTPSNVLNRYIHVYILVYHYTYYVIILPRPLYVLLYIFRLLARYGLDRSQLDPKADFRLWVLSEPPPHIQHGVNTITTGDMNGSTNVASLPMPIALQYIPVLPYLSSSSSGTGYKRPGGGAGGGDPGSPSSPRSRPDPLIGQRNLHWRLLSETE